MKKLYLFLCLAIFATSCQEKYTFSDKFSTPQTLKSPDAVELDVTSTSTVVLSWEGGGAADGGTVLYEVLFDKAAGDFTEPVARMYSDLKAQPMLTLTHAQINTIARAAGILPLTTGDLKWTVLTSKGGQVRSTELTKRVEVTRGEGIDNIPAELYLVGSGAENSTSAKFRTVEEGVYVIYTKTRAGQVKFKSSTDADALEFTYVDGKFSQGEGNYTTTAAATPVRITVNLNTLSLTTETIGSQVRMIWGVTFADMAVLDYVGDGKFVGNGRIRFVSGDRPDTNPPGWLSWVDERYYFIAKVEGADKCWGRGDGVSVENPVGGEPASFYALYEFAWDQWEHLWKMSKTLDNTTCTVTIDTNDNNLMVHKFSNIQPII